MTDNDLKRFWAKVAKTKSCWLWTGAVLLSGGYGAFHLGARCQVARAHRVSWEIANGPIPTGAHLLHRCDVPACVNPKHLRLGTNAENIHDKVMRARQPRGESHGNARLTEAKVRAIRGARASGDSQYTVAMAFGVSRSTISAIDLGRLWSYLR